MNHSIKLLLLFFISITVLSCSNDDEGGSQVGSDAALIGQWVGTGIDYSGNTVTEFQGQTINADFVGEAFDIDYTLTFSENPNEVISDGTYSIELTTTILGQSTTETVPNIGFLESGTWVKDGDQLTITNNGQTTTATIVELTNDTLVISAVEEETLSQQGATITSTVNLLATFTR